MPNDKTGKEDEEVETIHFDLDEIDNNKYKLTVNGVDTIIYAPNYITACARAMDFL